MKKFTVYFEIFGKRMKTDVLAENEQKAKDEIKSKINFHSVVEKKQTLDDVIKEGEDLLNKLMGK